MILQHPGKKPKKKSLKKYVNPTPVTSDMDRYDMPSLSIYPTSSVPVGFTSHLSDFEDSMNPDKVDEIHQAMLDEDNPLLIKILF